MLGIVELIITQSGWAGPQLGYLEECHPRSSTSIVPGLATFGQAVPAEFGQPNSIDLCVHDSTEHLGLACWVLLNHIPPSLYFPYTRMRTLSLVISAHHVYT